MAFNNGKLDSVGVELGASGKGRVIRFGAQVLLLLVAVTAVARVGSTAGFPLDDRSIRQAVEDEFERDPVIRIEGIETVVEGGIVTLTGTVATLLTRDRAERIAGTVRGVRAVINRTEVVSRYRRPDSVTRKYVRSDLVTNPTTEVQDIDVTVSDGVVTLAGTVNSWQEFFLAEQVAKGIRGVTGVRNELTVQFDTQRADDEIRAEVADALKWDVLVDASGIEVEVEGGHVVLRGAVRFVAERDRAVGDAWLAGVRSVDASRLRVDPARTFVPVVRRFADDEIRQAVADVLDRDPRVDAARVTLEVSRGVVVLRGSVRTVAARRIAERDARNTTGTVEVVNRLQVRPHAPVGAEVGVAAATALSRAPCLDDSEVEVSVAGGVAHLGGAVATSAQKACADQAVARIEGVLDVQNRIHVLSRVPEFSDPMVDELPVQGFGWAGDRIATPPDVHGSDREIAERIRGQLFWSPVVDADDIRVEVLDGRVTLTGVVDSWAEREAAVKNAFDGGAAQVRDRMVHRSVQKQQEEELEQ